MHSSRGPCHANETGSPARPGFTAARKEHRRSGMTCFSLKRGGGEWIREARVGSRGEGAGGGRLGKRQPLSRNPATCSLDLQHRWPLSLLLLLLLPPPALALAQVALSSAFARGKCFSRKLPWRCIARRGRPGRGRREMSSLPPPPPSAAAGTRQGMCVRAHVPRGSEPPSPTQPPARRLLRVPLRLQTLRLGLGQAWLQPPLRWEGL